MMRRIAAVSLLGGMALAAAACNSRTGGGRNVVANPANGDSQPKSEIGNPLFVPKQAPPRAVPNTSTVEPIIFAANARVVEKVDVPAQHDGKILFIGTEIKPGEVVS